MADGNGRVQRMIFQLVLFRWAPGTSLNPTARSGLGVYGSQ